MADDPAAWRGRVIDDRYEVEDVLGKGGMGVVLRARHKFTGATVAVKVLHEELSRDPQLQRRFLTEARASNAIGHPGIVAVLDAGRDDRGMLYVAMELLAGESLRAVMSRGVTAAEAGRIARELVEVLGAAHAKGFIHRDLKPENIFLVAGTGAVKLLDFGIAKVVSGKRTLASTARGALLGSIAYMAPEQLDDAASVDPRADLWSVGAMLYEMLAGRIPFDAASPEELFAAVASEEPTPIGMPALEPFFARALARDPQGRFATTDEFSAALTQLPLGGVTAMPTRPPPPAPSVVASAYDPPRKRSVLPLVAGGVGAVAAGVLAFAIVSRGRSGAGTGSGSGSAQSDVPGDACETGCKLMTSCELARTDCEAECKARPEVASCFAGSKTCRDVGVCAIAIDCHAVPAGTQSCSGYAMTHSRCDMRDPTCRCGDVAGLAPKAAQTLAAFHACALTCGDDLACPQARCGDQMRACFAQ